MGKGPHGILVPGAVWEIKPPREPRIGFLDGYVTVDFQEWHLHLCIGEQASAPPEVAHQRRTNRAELYRRLKPGPAAHILGVPPVQRGGHQQITVLLPNPHLDEDQQYEKEPRWERLYLWDRLREKYLKQGRTPGTGPASQFFHG